MATFIIILIANYAWGLKISNAIVIKRNEID